MIRLTERDEYGNAEIIAIGMSMPTVYDGLTFLETNALTAALNRLAAYEDTGLMPEEIKAKQGWISVKEMLPEYGKRCIFFSECNRVAYTGMLHHVGAQGAVWFATDKRYSTQYTAKWWMPIPEPPKEVSE